jgi:hypothetical protein
LVDATTVLEKDMLKIKKKKRKKRRRWYSCL